MQTGALASEPVASLLPGGAPTQTLYGMRCELVPPYHYHLHPPECRPSIPAPGRQSCTKHAPAYDASYKRYKDAESAAKDLRAAAQTRRGDVHTLPLGDVGPRIGSVRAYIEALEREVRLRNEHDQRFIGDRE
uniref:Uncharacterized protein n=1 Tax=Ganoderma boninense TaxID=34458 RepID=A0A5K1K345_9APHY|nr:Uncharacterized protein [Ganoderma boninense]